MKIEIFEPETVDFINITVCITFMHTIFGPVIPNNNLDFFPSTALLDFFFRSMILSERPNDDDSQDGFTKWPFMTTHTWAEYPR